MLRILKLISLLWAITLASAWIFFMTGRGDATPASGSDSTEKSDGGLLRESGPKYFNSTKAPSAGLSGDIGVPLKRLGTQDAGPGDAGKLKP